MKNKSVLTAILFLLSTPAFAGADKGGNGGDICENRIKTIAADLSTWIQNGGSSDLKLPRGVLASDYNTIMLEAISKTQVSCVDTPVLVGSSEKICKNVSDGLPKMTCNRGAFLRSKESDQYVLIHHEYAGISGLEVNQGDVSNYEVSNQIVGFLQDELIKKLVVKPTLSIIDQVLQTKQTGPLHRDVLFVELSNYDPYSGARGFFSSARDSYDGGGNTYGWSNYATLKEALTGIATRLVVVGMREEVIVASPGFKKAYLDEFRKLLYSPQLAIGMSDDEIADLDLALSGMEDVYLRIGVSGDGTTTVSNFNGSTVAWGKSFADALKAAVRKLEK
jgi:hypothetical protein